MDLDLNSYGIDIIKVGFEVLEFSFKKLNHKSMVLSRGEIHNFEGYFYFYKRVRCFQRAVSSIPPRCKYLGMIRSMFIWLGETSHGRDSERSEEVSLSLDQI